MIVPNHREEIRLDQAGALWKCSAPSDLAKLFLGDRLNSKIDTAYRQGRRATRLIARALHFDCHIS